MIKRIFAVLITIILVALILVPTINDSSHEVEIEPEVKDPSVWSYDDYHALADVQSVSGAVELVTLGDASYVHAKGLGSATVTYASGEVEEITVEKSKLDVYLALGQSNNSYVNADTVTASPKPSPGTSYYYGTESTLITSRSSDLTEGDFFDVVNTDTGTLRIGDKVPAFGATYYSLTNVKTYYIDAAWMGSSVVWWQDVNSQIWTSAITVVESAMAKIPVDYYDVTVRGYTWIQGERDATVPIQTYIDCFNTMNARILNGDLGASVDHCFMSKVREANAANPSPAQIQIAEEDDTVTMCTRIADTFTKTNGLMGNDDLHYTQLGNNLIGDALAECCAEYYYGEEKEVVSLKLLSVIPLLTIFAGLTVLIPTRRD